MDDEIIPDELKPLVDASMDAMSRNAVKRQEESEYEAEWRLKAISIEDVDKFLDDHGKTGVVMFYWDSNDVGSPVTIQVLNVGKTRADQVMGAMIRGVVRGAGLA